MYKPQEAMPPRALKTTPERRGACIGSLLFVRRPALSASVALLTMLSAGRVCIIRRRPLTALCFSQRAVAKRHRGRSATASRRPYGNELSLLRGIREPNLVLKAASSNCNCTTHTHAEAGQHVRGDVGGASADRACSVKTGDSVRARVFVIAQLVLNSLLSMLSQRAPRTAG